MLGSGGPRRERMSGVGSTYSFCAPPSRRAVWPSREAERSSFTRAGMERARERAAGVALYTAAHSNKAQNTGAVEGDDLAGSKFCAHQDRRRERDGGKVPRPVRDTSIRSEMARTSEGGGPAYRGCPSAQRGIPGDP